MTSFLIAGHACIIIFAIIQVIRAYRKDTNSLIAWALVSLFLLFNLLELSGGSVEKIWDSVLWFASGPVMFLGLLGGSVSSFLLAGSFMVKAEIKYVLMNLAFGLLLLVGAISYAASWILLPILNNANAAIAAVERMSR